ncbi:MAG: arginine--tRNA ligase [Candidatus Margulisbacteria bacterium]|nr:arginine--tRNA ligase [Candidatus Margulisiibacteriota bacterium]
MIQQQLQGCIFQALKNLKIDITPDQIDIEKPKNPEHGDYATNLAMRLVKVARLRQGSDGQAKKAPPQIALDILNELEKDKKAQKYFSFSVVGGYVNIKLTDSYLIEILSSKVNKDFGKSVLGKGQKVLLEFVSANPTGPLHIGHGRWAAIGDVLANILKYTGFKVTEEFYINDQGNQVESLRASVEAVRQNKEIPADGYHGHYVQNLAKEKKDPIKLLLAQQKAVLNKMGVEFDSWFSEKKLHQQNKVKQAIELLQKKDLVEKRDKAVWFKSSDFGDDKDRVLIRETGEATYFAADIAYHKNKLARGYDLLINIWGADHHGYVARLKAALKALTGDKDFNKLHIILGQLVTLYRAGVPVRMSKRTGEMITLEEVIEEIGQDAARYFLVSRSTDTHLDFDLEIAKKKSEENPVYYIQYAHARICSILRQNEAQIKGSIKRDTLESLERKIILAIAQIPDELELISQTYNIHRLTYLAQELAKMFHSFYHEYRVLSDNKEDTLWRLEFIKAIKQVLEIILTLLGVSAPERM